MTDPLFFVFIVISILGYGIHIPLITYFARKTDAVIVTVYRNLSFVILIVPLLYLVPLSEIAAITDHAWILLLASITGFISFIWNLKSKLYLPVGISSAIIRVFNVIGAVILGALLFAEFLSVAQLFLLVGILAGAVALSLLRSEHAHLDITKAWRGVIFSIATGFGATVAFFFFTILSRELNPFVASYFWEVSVGVCALVYMLSRRMCGYHYDVVLLSLRQVLMIAGASLFVVGGTVGMAFAVNYGPFSLATGLGTVAILVSTVISWFLFKEHLTKLQIALILFVVFLMFLLKAFT